MAINLLKNLNFAEKINSTDAVTESGKEMLKGYRGFCYTNAVECSTVNSFVKEAQQYKYDTGLVNILESVLSFINENKISWKLASACESISKNNSTYGYLAKTGVEQVQKMLEMNESDVVSYIKSGALRGVQYIPEFRNICKEVFKSTINEVRTESYTITNPVSCVFLGEGKQYFSVNGKTYSISEGTVSADTCEDERFNIINAHLSGMKKVDENLEFEYQINLTSQKTKYVVSENAINFTRGNVNESFATANGFRQYADNLSKTMPAYEASQFMAISNAIAEVYESIDNICVVDCVNLISSSNGSQVVMLEAQNNVMVDVLRSYKYGTSSNSYEFVIEACNDVQKITGVDVKALYESRINEDTKQQDPEGYKAIQEALEAEKENAFAVRRQKIAMLAEKYKNDPARIALLNHTARELALLEQE